MIVIAGENAHGIISMITVTNWPECTTDLLRLPEQDKEWTWNYQHEHSYQHARMHNSPSVIAKAGQRIIISMITVTSIPECTTHPL
jgi:hypothetical protein